jgi:hypothetical protein
LRRNEEGGEDFEGDAGEDFEAELEQTEEEEGVEGVFE